MKTHNASRAGVGKTIRLEQDGFLRAFDTATVLWPAAYLLTRAHALALSPVPVAALPFCGLAVLMHLSR